MFTTDNVLPDMEEFNRKSVEFEHTTNAALIEKYGFHEVNERDTLLIGKYANNEAKAQREASYTHNKGTLNKMLQMNDEERMEYIEKLKIKYGLTEDES
jgi:hypothetical protein